MQHPIPVLLYHHVNDSGSSSTTRPAEFRSHLDWLQRHGWTTLTLAEFEAAVTGGVAPGPKRFLLTYDDGSADLVRCGDEMRQRHMTGVAFVITGQLDAGKPGYLDRAGIIDLAKDGTFEIQCHTHRHVHVGPDSGDFEALVNDLRQSRSYLADQLGLPAATQRHLAWPWGECTPAMEQAALELGFTWQYLVQRGALTRRDRQVRLPRLCADGIPTRELALWMTLFGAGVGAGLVNRVFGTIRAKRHGLAYR